jgi:predicted metal-binding membrane protein
LNGRLLLPAFIVVTTALSWWWIAVMGVDMYGSMNGASAWMMTPVWDAPHVLLLFAMWTVMMVAMMLPSVSPLLLIYNGVARRTPVPGYSPAYVYLVALGYLAVWSLFSLGATVLQRVLSRAFVLNPMMELASRRTSAGLLVAAGIYQMLPMKAACLRQCRAPVAFLTEHASPGAGGAFQLGVEDSFDPRQNIMGGVKYLAWLLDVHHGNVELALASYNAGPGAVDRYHGVPPFKETRQYIKTINGIMHEP